MKSVVKTAAKSVLLSAHLFNDDSSITRIVVRQVISSPGRVRPDPLLHDGVGEGAAVVAAAELELADSKVAHESHQGGVGAVLLAAHQARQAVGVGVAVALAQSAAVGRVAAVVVAHADRVGIA